MVWEYNKDLFDPTTIERMAKQFHTLLNGIIVNPATPLSALPLLTATEKEQLLREWNNTYQPFELTECLHDLFTKQAAQTPDATAIVWGSEQLTYQQVNIRANQFAHYLTKLGVGREVSVGICLPRSLEMVIALFGVLKAGGAIVALDLTYPKERLAFVIQDARMPLLITHTALMDMLPITDVLTIYVDKLAAQLAQESGAEVTTKVDIDNLLYVIYTSGSTGLPKGVGVTHGAILNLLAWQNSDARLSRPAKTLQFATFGFCVSFQEIFSTLLSGATLVIVSDEERKDMEALLMLLENGEIERLHLPFAALKNLAQICSAKRHFPPCLRDVITAGEQLQITATIANLFHHSPHASLHNQYGASETHVVSAFTLANDPSSWPTIPPIGRPIANTEIYLLDRNIEPVPIGVAGEVYIAGLGLGRNYLYEPVLTATKFLPHPFTKEAGARLYRTGDLARYLPNGDIEYFGRSDEQLKIRGFRVELSEIETLLRRHPLISDLAVLALMDKQDNKYLVAYVVVSQDVSINELKAFLKQQLPEYMLPTSFVFLAALPLNANGKLDRQALPLPEVLRPETGTLYLAPRNDLETVLASIWADTLNMEKVGIEDNFFDLGGHSLLATQVISRICDTFQMEIPLRSLFESPTVTGLAAIMQTDSEQAIRVNKIATLLIKVASLSESEVEGILAEKEQLEREPITSQALNRPRENNSNNIEKQEIV
jgi:amino acid adenylation domain-containing protein